MVKNCVFDDDPTAAWKLLSKSIAIREVDIKDAILLTTASSTNKLRIVCVSDTHGKTDEMKVEIPFGDVLIHAGDFTSRGSEHEVVQFNEWLGHLPHNYKLVIAGNHERTLDPRRNTENELECMKNKLTNCCYLEDSSVSIGGLKIYGTPWQPMYKRDSGFKILPGQQCLEKWNLIPNDVDILVTHVPPLGCNDLCDNGERAGCPYLLNTVKNRVKPICHIFGHIHEGHGASTDGETLFINASICTSDERPINKPIVVDVPVDVLS